MVSLAPTEGSPGLVAPSIIGGVRGSIGRSSLKRRHADTDLEQDSTDASTSQWKRRRVTFDPHVQVRIVGDYGKSMALVSEQVRLSIERKATGKLAGYNELKRMFQVSPTAEGASLTGLLHKYLVALTSHAPLFDHHCKGLVHAVIDCKWTARNERFVQSYRNFLRALLSVHTGYISTVLQMLVTMFRDEPSVQERQQDDPPVQRACLRDRLHDTLHSILRHSPIANSFLAPSIARTFPYINDNAKTHVDFVRNILRVANYAPEIRCEILSLVTEKLVKIDVQMQIDMEDLDDDLEEWLAGDALRDPDDDELDDHDHDNLNDHDHDDEEEDFYSDDSSVWSEESLDPEVQRLEQAKDQIRKLDNIMDIQFAYYDSIFKRGDWFEIDEIFESMLSQFANTVIPAYRSRHIQFILFHFSQTSTDLVSHFAGCCSYLAVDPSLPRLLRASAAAYLASFIARGAHVSGEVVRDVFDLLGYHLEDLRMAHEPTCNGPDLRRYNNFYTISQALIYIFCFRWRDLIVTPDGIPPTDADIIHHDGDFSWYASVQDVMRRTIFCRLNPLKICAPTIVAQFARIAHHLRFMYIYPLIETNKRVRLTRNMASGYLDSIGGRETALASTKYDSSLVLDAYFPFDPYVLPRSKRWVEGDYVQWVPVPGMAKEKEGDDDEVEGKDEEDAESDEDDESGSQQGNADDAHAHIAA